MSENTMNPAPGKQPNQHKSTLVTSFMDRQLECSCGFRTRVADGFKLSIFDIEDEYREHLAAVATPREG